MVAIAIRAATGADPRELAVNRFNLAKLLWDLDQRDESRELAALAGQSLRELQAYSAVQGEITDWIAKH